VAPPVWNQENPNGSNGYAARAYHVAAIRVDPYRITGGDEVKTDFKFGGALSVSLSDPGRLPS
jgi:hypothetical protein